MPRALHAVTLVTVLLATALGYAQQPPSQSQMPNPAPPLGTASFTPPPKTDSEALTPQTFVTRAAVANMSELDLSQLALRKTSTPAIQVFASTVMRDHKAADAKLKAIAAKLKIALPGTVDDKHRALKTKLGELYAREFDTEFARVMASSHDEAVTFFEGAAQSATLPPELKDFASAQLATFTKHQRAAHEL